jgi:predicted ATPase/class 3 adenylate cyclase
MSLKGGVMRCADCGTDNPAGRKFCGGCGAVLARVCPSCGAPNEAQFAFCGDCGARLDDLAATPTALRTPTAGSASVGATAEPRAERRLVSVLFADLVGFTTLSESRDPEDVRELLTRYFDACRSRITRYGGTVEKFIGDAVMAVWGAPVANEDDAERAVRAALELVDAVRDLGRDIGAESLAARAGVLTGEAAVNLVAQSEGMVAGDLVNSASRVQGIAAPGTVLVDDATRRATEAAVAYADAGTHELKGKSEAIALWRPLRVVAGRGGAQRSAGLEAPFVGRARELGLIKDLFHGCAENGVAHLATVTGAAGIGKSRLSWELYKYLDGLTDTALWHRGRCLAYGEGVTYWALGEMIRARAGIREDEATDTAESKLAAMVTDIVADEDERRWVQPRLGSLLGLAGHDITDASDLFSGWRLFFERLAQQHPVVLVFEDLQWADEALLDFIEYLLEWSRNHQLFVLTLARPELADRRAGWGAGRRNVTALSLDPLPDQAMDELLDGLVPGLPEPVLKRIRERAEGVPLYAVETVRMLVDRGTLAREGDRYVPVGQVEDLDVPETLQALIAARLDGLEPAERSLLQHASVLGKTFSAAALAAVNRQPEAELQPLLSGLVRKELLGVQADPRSPERGQYGFLQSLVQKIAHDTLSRRDRKSLHLAAAGYLQQNWADEGEVVQVIAAHYLAAYESDETAADAAEIRASARDFLSRSGERAAALAAQEEAQRYFLSAAELTDDAAEHATLLLRSGRAAWRSGNSAAAEERYADATERFRAIGDASGAAMSLKELGLLQWWDHSNPQEGVRLLREAEELAAEAPDEVRAEVLEALGRCLFFSGDHDACLGVLDQTLDLAEARRLLPVLADAMNTKALVLSTRQRVEEALSLLQGALRVALDSGLASPAMRAYTNLSYLASEADRLEEGLGYATAAVALARTLGDRKLEWFSLSHVSAHDFWTGHWDDFVERLAGIPDWHEVPDARSAATIAAASWLNIQIERGALDDAAATQEVFEPSLESPDLQERGVALTNAAAYALSVGDARRAMELSNVVITELMPLLSRRHPALRMSLQTYLEAALALGETAAAESVVADFEGQPVGHLSPFLRAQTARFRARLELTQGRLERVEERFRTSAAIFEEAGLIPFLATVRAELAEWLVQQGREADAEPLLSQAVATFEALRMQPWLTRLAAIRPVAPTAAASA